MSNEIPVLNQEEWLTHLGEGRQRVPPGGYRAMYSSWWGGIVTDPRLMLVPMDDHLVHRGDGVFEAFRVVNGAIYDLRAHLRRLEKSAARIGLRLPGSLPEIEQTVVATVRVSGLDQAAVRLFVSRGPGGFSPNPFESPESQLYVVVTDFKPMPEPLYEKGVRVMVSSVAAKEAPYSQIKSCNYLQNVLMKKEAVESGYDFAVAVNGEGYICEGATENIALITPEGVMRIPRFDYTLRGTTLMSVLDLIKQHEDSIPIQSTEFTDLTVADFWQAQEVVMVGTTLEVLPVREFANSPIGSGGPWPVARKLRELLQSDMQKNTVRRTLVRG